jgi:hypothetical protein
MDEGIDGHTQVPDLRVASPSASDPRKVSIEGEILNWPIMSFNVFDKFKYALSQEENLVE